MNSNPLASKAFAPVARGACILTLALVAGPFAWAGQDQPPPAPQDPQQQQQSQPAPAPDAQQGQNQDRPPQPPPPPQNKAQQAPPQNPKPGDQRKVISKDTIPGNDDDQNNPNDVQQQPGPGNDPNLGPWRGNRPNGGPQSNRALPAPHTPVPDTLTLASGTIIQVRTNDFLSSDHNKSGEGFTAVLAKPLVVNGWVVARRGETIEGIVRSAKKAGRVKGTSELELQLTSVTTVDGQVVPLQTALWQGSGGTSHGADAATIVGTTGLGAAIGAAANWGTGAAVGAGAGLLAGVGAVLLTRGRPTIVPPESPLSFQLTEAVNIQTGQGKQAYLPARPGDYEAGGPRRQLRPYPVGYPGPYPYCGYYRPCFARPYGYYPY